MTNAMDVDPKDAETSLYETVVYRKRTGTLTLTPQHLLFHATAPATSSSSPVLRVSWDMVSKHQVSPITYPKAMLKLILMADASVSSSANHVTFQLADRKDLERIRHDITQRLQEARLSHTNHTRKRTHAELSSTDPANSTEHASSFDRLDPHVLAVTRSTLLAANASLRAQHSHLVRETQTLSEDDFWETHKAKLEEEYARIAGVCKPGMSSYLASHLPSAGKIVLGIEEMRQIFILYPAVHKAYEEKVPLELSDEQFWRKYLESEYFHRDRGRMGETARNHADPATMDKGRRRNAGPSVEEQEARAAAVGTDDLFSRYDQKIREQQQIQQQATDASKARRLGGRQLACGQFDLASTYETERGRLLEPKDYFPPNQADDGKGARVIQKYNRHWAMVLHPEDATAGSDLQKVARKSVQEIIPGDEDAKAGGGLDKEMKQLVALASANRLESKQAIGAGLHQEYEKLTINNIETKYCALQGKENQLTVESEEAAIRRHIEYARTLAEQTAALARAVDKQTAFPSQCFPSAAFGRDLLSALTMKMAKDAKTEEASLETVRKLPEELREKLKVYFGRSSELLRHFYGLRKLDDEYPANTEKLARIVRGMETFYREMEAMRKELPQTETGETMRKMCLPIMDQLDWAFKLYRDSSGSGGGGFVTVEG